jgi:hypothetical protein
MKKLFPITIIAFAAAALFVSDVEAKSVTGTCNQIIASALGSAQACADMSCEPTQCLDVTNAFVEFVATEGCLVAFQNGELKGLSGPASVQPSGPNTARIKNIQSVVCGSLDTCGLCPSALVLGICPNFCLPPIE